KSKEFGSSGLEIFYKTWMTNFAQNAARFNLTFLPVLQAHRWDELTCNDPDRMSGFPTLAEARYTIYAAIQAGAKGLCFFDNSSGGDASTLEARWAETNLPVLLDEFE